MHQHNSISENITTHKQLQPIEASRPPNRHHLTKIKILFKAYTNNNISENNTTHKQLQPIETSKHPYSHH